MKLPRAALFGVQLWLASFLIYLLGRLTPASTTSELKQYAFFWLTMIPITLLLAKWYFKADPPSSKKGLWLGLIAIAVGMVLDVLFFLLSGRVEEFWEFYGNLYFWLAVLEIVVLTTFAGWEYDRTYTKREPPA